MESNRDEPFVVDVQMRWSDMDVLAHVNNVAIARLFEEARVRAMNDWSAGREQGRLAAVVARQEIEFVAPLYYDARPARCSVAVSRIGGTSFDFACVLTSPDGEVAALCETTLVVLEGDGARPQKIDGSLHETLTANLSEPVPFRSRRVTA